MVTASLDVVLDWNDLVTVKEVAQTFRIHTRTVERAFAKGLPCFELFGKLYTSKKAIAEMAKHRGVPVANEPTKRQRDAVDAELDRRGF
jgi:hypothetical protein